MAKFCGHCGNALVEGARACGNCGAFVDGSVNVYADGANQNGASNNSNVNTNNVNNNANSTDLGTIGFIISIVSSLICCGRLNFISLILCIIALVDSNKNPNINRGLSIAGIIISCAGFIFVFFGSIIGVFFSFFFS